MSIKNELTRLGVAKTSIAEAISKKGVNVPSGALLDEYASMIDQIETGGQTSPPSAEVRDINFYDYDGTIIASYTIDEFASVTELPIPPDHDRLLFQGWNWSMADIKSLGRPVDVGAIYVTRSGKSEFDIMLNSVTGLNVTLRIYNVTAGNTITVDWGDGITEDDPTTTAGAKTFTHTYAETGQYTAMVDSTGAYYLHGSAASPYNMFGGNPSYICTAARFGTRCTKVSSYTFYRCCSLTSVTIPESITDIGVYAFYSCYNLTSINIPDGVADIVSNMCYTCSCLTSIAIPRSVTNIASVTLQNCYSLTSVTIPDRVANIAANALNGCSALSKITLLGITPPTLANINTFTYIPATAVMYVPAGSLEAYQTATNWATYANYMREAES